MQPPEKFYQLYTKNQQIWIGDEGYRSTYQKESRKYQKIIAANEIRGREEKIERKINRDQEAVVKEAENARK